MKIYVAHNITAAQGGHILGIFSTYRRAKNALKSMTGWPDGCTDWGHFIRVGKMNQPMYVLNLPKSNEEKP